MATINANVARFVVLADLVRNVADRIAHAATFF